MSTKLLEFPHSHYCEKARWALDYKNIPFLAQPVLPGFHVITVGRIAPATSVPVLLDKDLVIQGSGDIINYLDQEYPGNPLTPSEPELSKKSLEIEENTGKLLGENLRQILYHKLLSYPSFIRDCFTHTMPWPKKFIFSILYPVLRQKIYRRYVISEKSVVQAKDEFKVALDELGVALTHKPYLVGEQFTRADLSVASMLSLLVLPPEHPFPWGEIPDTEIRAFCAGYEDHPVAIWVLEMYRLHR